jgi:hypothetical protein
MKSAKMLTVVVLMQALILVGQWLGSPQMVSQANAQVPDAGGQRLEMINELKSLNAKMERMVSILESGKLEVKVQRADDKAGH